MILRQFYLNCLAHASYLVADEASGLAAVVDPQRDVDQYLTFAADHGLRIAHVFLTHFHADFIAGHLELRDRAGATIYLGRAGECRICVHAGRRRQTSSTSATCASRCWRRPGHTPESISIVVYDLQTRERQSSRMRC